jgi:hypothetical protein
MRHPGIRREPWMTSNGTPSRDISTA